MMPTSSSWFGRDGFRSSSATGVWICNEGECVLVPRGVEHRTSAAEDAYVLCFEPAGTVNTGNLAANEFTAPCGVSIFDTDDAAQAKPD